MQFGESHLLPWLLLVPALLVLGLVAAGQRRRRLARWAEAALWPRLAPSRSSGLRMLRFALALVALAFALLAAARPQVGASLVQVERSGIEVVMLLDVSLSMEATDVVPNRLERSKQEIRELCEALRGDRVGVVVFAGSSFLLCPLTLDVAAANLFLDAVSVDILPDPGTDISAALEGAWQAFEGDDNDFDSRAVVLFTDGESHVGDPEAILGRLAEEKVPVLTVGVGTPNGEPIPLRDEDGRISGYKKDRSGNVVLSRLDEGLLRHIAETTGGRYFPATLQGREVEAMADFLHKLERGELGGTLRRRVDERYQIPAAVAAVLLFLSFVVPETRRRPAGSLFPQEGTRA